MEYNLVVKYIGFGVKLEIKYNMCHELDILIFGSLLHLFMS